MTLEQSYRYDDIIDLPHHRSIRHPPLSMHNRDAQFMPFAALTGYEDIIAETARRTVEEVDRANMPSELMTGA